MPNSIELKELSAGLVGELEHGHWQCNDEFARLTGLDRDALKKVLPCYAVSPRWIDLLATEIAISLAVKAGPWEGLAKDWKAQTLSWIEATFQEAANETSTVPPRPLLHTKGMLLADSVLSKMGARPASAVVYSSSRVTCETCNRTYSSRLDKCPGCAEKEREAKRAQERQAAEMRDAEWRALASLPLGLHGETDLCWADASQVKFCHGGSGGAVIVRFPHGAVCIKGAQYTPGELFAQSLASSLNVCVASCRVVQAEDQEAAEICKAVRSAEPVNSESQGCQHRGAPFTLLQYVDGVTMMGLPAHQYLQSIRKTDNADALWSQLGRLMAFDTLLNNFDRLPLVWSNDGNLGNVMIGSSLGVVVGIDQSVAPISHPAGLSGYLGRVRQVVREARDGTGKAFEAVRIAIKTNTATDLDATELALLRSGALDFFAEIAALMSSGILQERLNAVCRDLHVTVREVAYTGKANDTAQHFSDLVQKVAAVVQEELACDDLQHLQEL